MLWLIICMAENKENGVITEIKSQLLTDGIVFRDKQGDHVVFNHYTWINILYGIFQKYAHCSAPQAKALILSSPISNRTIDHYDAMTVSLTAHEEEYHWAMLIAHGEGYWRRGISSDFPADYDEWYDAYVKENGLAEESVEFKN